MSEYTHIRIKKELLDKLRLKAIAENRSLTNYIEQVLLKSLEEKGV